MQIVGTCIALAAMFAAATAAPLPAAPHDQVITAVSVDDLKALVSSRGDTLVPFASESKEVAMGGGTKDDISYGLIGGECDRGKVKRCSSILMLVTYNGVSNRMSWEQIDAAARKHAAISVAWLPTSGSVRFSRYVVVSGGITLLNLRTNLEALVAQTRDARRELWPDKFK